MEIIGVEAKLNKLPLISPFGFKGSFSNAISLSCLEIKTKTLRAKGESIQGVLWSDGNLYGEIGEEKINDLMFQITKNVANSLIGKKLEKPEDMFFDLFKEAEKQAMNLLGYLPRKTFLLNSLVALDNALRILYAKSISKKNYETFASLEGIDIRRQNKLAFVPLVSYNTKKEEIEKLADEGVFVFKIKIGVDPDLDNDKAKMLEGDKKRLKEVHDILKIYTSPYTDSGRLAYYLDANGRYDSLERVKDLLDYAKKIDAFSNILLLEEPFDEFYDEDVSSLGVTVVADESLHDKEDALKKIKLGYKAFALKPIAKTISATNEIMELGLIHNIDMFCADLTVSPMLVEINKSYAACLPSIKGLKCGLLESNGAQNYSNWQVLMEEHPLKTSSFVSIKDGVYELDDEFFMQSAGIFKYY